MNWFSRNKQQAEIDRLRQEIADLRNDLNKHTKILVDQRRDSRIWWVNDYVPLQVAFAALLSHLNLRMEKALPPAASPEIVFRRSCPTASPEGTATSEESN